MIRLAPVLLPLTAVIIFFCGCSSTPSDTGKGTAATTAPAVAAGQQFDFGSSELSPASGSGKEATFRVMIKRGSKTPLLIGLLINDRQTGENACYAFRNLASKESSLVADAGAGAILIGKKASVANRQCELLSDGTGSTQDDSGITATFHIRFLPAFRGAKHTWTMPTDAGGNGPAMQQLGDWTVQ